MNELMKYLEGSGELGSDEQSNFKYFPRNAFCWRDINNIVQHFSAIQAWVRLSQGRDGRWETNRNFSAYYSGESILCGYGILLQIKQNSNILENILVKCSYFPE